MKQNKIPELIILVGVPGSGKTTWSTDAVKRQDDLVRVGRDGLRKQFKDAYVVGERIEKLVSDAQDALIETLLAKKYSVIVDNTHCKLKYIKELISKYASKATISVKYFGKDTQLKELKQRNTVRTKPVPEDVLERMYNNFNTLLKNRAEVDKALAEAYELGVVNKFKQDDSLPKCILVDIDGTVAHMGDHRGPFEWHKVDRDDPDNEILEIVRSLSRSYKIVFMSGRDESCRELTTEWLQAYYKNEDIELYMRPANNFEKDNKIKFELFHRYISKKYYVQAILDDRDQVVKMWRNELGLKCLQVAYGNF